MVSRMNIKDIATIVSLAVILIGGSLGYGSTKYTAKKNEESIKTQWQIISKMDDRIRSIEIKMGVE